MLSAISFGVRCRSEPSTRAIIRSTNDCPGSEVIRTTIRSESTTVPPVTAERSPPDSRITGADSPVTADSSTDATPSMTSPSPGIRSPASTTTTSPARSDGAGDLVDLEGGQVAGVRQLVAAAAHAAGGRLLLEGTQAGGLGLAAALGHGLGQGAEEHGQPEPDRDADGQRAGVEDGHHRGGGGADLDDEHHGVTPQLARVELAQGGGQRLAELAAEGAPYGAGW